MPDVRAAARHKHPRSAALGPCRARDLRAFGSHLRRALRLALLVWRERLWIDPGLRQPERNGSAVPEPFLNGAPGRSVESLSSLPDGSVPVGCHDPDKAGYSGCGNLRETPLRRSRLHKGSMREPSGSPFPHSHFKTVLSLIDSASASCRCVRLTEPWPTAKREGRPGAADLYNFAEAVVK